MTLKNSLNESCKSDPIPAVIITGPTASGKTSLSLELAEKTGSDILCCDSMQVYRHMDIGTAKATAEEQRRVPHHLIDLAEPWEEYSVADYCKEAQTVVRSVQDAGRHSVFVGGTGLYVTSLMEGYSYEPAFQSDEKLRHELDQMAASAEGVASLYEFLRAHDPDAADQIHIHNTKRLVRAVELYKLTGLTQAKRHEQSKAGGSFLRASVFALDWERERLYQRINSRVDDMLAQGLIEEVETILAMCREKGKPLSKTAAQAIGYKETIAYLQGRMTREDMTASIKNATRHYAKRQMTWLRKWPWVQWVKPEEARTRILSTSF